MFTDRVEAGRRLAERLQHLRDDNPVVLGLPRGGVPVALEVATALDAPLDVIVVRKLGAPFQAELAMGAIGEDGVVIVNWEVVRSARLDESELIAAEMQERGELERRVKSIRGSRPAIPLAGRTVIIVDDGIASGSTARAACEVARARGATKVVLAAPVAPSWLGAVLSDAADFVVFSESLDGLYAISNAYEDFTQVTDEEVAACLARRPAAVASVAAVAHHEHGIDVAMERAGEEARGVETFENPYLDEAPIVAREEAEGVELFEDPDSDIPIEALVEGAPGHESLSGNDLGLGRNADNNHREEQPAH